MNNAPPVLAEILEITPLAMDTTLFTLRTEFQQPVANLFLPGQFLELSLPGVGEFPVSYCGYPTRDGTIELCIRHIGHVTSPLKYTKRGETIGLRGPFGRGFPLISYTAQDLLLVAGGLGIAPIRSLLLALVAERERYRRIRLFYAAREANLLLFLSELQELERSAKIELILAVESFVEGRDSKADFRVALLPSLLSDLEIDPVQTSVAVCGPAVVYPFVVTAIQAMGVPDERIHLSLERRMKCGVGQCGHCAVGEYLCCVDGPVFSVAKLTGIEGAIG